MVWRYMALTAVRLKTLCAGNVRSGADMKLIFLLNFLFQVIFKKIGAAGVAHPVHVFFFFFLIVSTSRNPSLH